ncbi:putative membrane protein [Neobacillus niacini]|uniref:cytochrome c oxidase assembly factor CtaG n=1 Tax=Neobacillus niacini TaxID=86668 RepID=UPI00278500C9|nr:cytochrome c oxidase assembly factor CtaG [Neobacillus niacini]MDQ1003551.1 putative membrane protein [Neobacillus niacini]
MAIFYLFDFRSLWSPFFALNLFLILLLYYLISVKYRNCFKQSEPLTKKQAANFTGFILLLYLIKGSPIDLMSHMMLTIHMVQMAFLLLIMPILFIKGIPDWIWRTVLDIKLIKPLFLFITKPLIAMLLFNVLFSFYHIPIILDFSKTNNFYHALMHSLLFFLAIFMFWPVLNNINGSKTMSGILKTGYMFANGVLMLPACALIIFADIPLYQTYSNPETWINALALCATPSSLSRLGSVGPELLKIFNPLGSLQDQKLGGILMKTVQEIVYVVIIAQIFAEWYRKDINRPF